MKQKSFIKSVINKLENDSKLYRSFEDILQKSISDGYLKVIINSIKFVFKQEIKYAINQLIKLKQLNKKLKVKTLLDTNMFVFKENTRDL